MSLCALCSLPALGAGSLCVHHSSGQPDNWAVGNRIMCDFLHRGIVSPTPSELDACSIELRVESLAEALTE